MQAPFIWVYTYHVLKPSFLTHRTWQIINPRVIWECLLSMAFSHPVSGQKRYRSQTGKNSAVKTSSVIQLNLLSLQLRYGQASRYWLEWHTLATAIHAFTKTGDWHPCAAIPDCIYLTYNLHPSRCTCNSARFPNAMQIYVIIDNHVFNANNSLEHSLIRDTRINILGLRQNGRHFADHNYKCNFFNQNV